MSGHQYQMGRLRKFTGASLLNRFRSSSKTTSEDEETAAAARPAGTNDVSGTLKTLSSANVSDPVTGCRISPSGDVAGHTWSSPSRGQGKSNETATSSKTEKLMNGTEAETQLKHLSQNAADCDERQESQEALQSTTDVIINAIAADPINPPQASGCSPKRPSSLPTCHDDSDTDGVRVYKKVSTNGKLVLYLLNRDLIITKENITPLHAVITVDAEEVRNKKIFAQILLTFRYGRDDEEVMGLKLSNESVLCVEQIYPLLPGAPLPQPLTKCQEVLMKRLGPNAHLVNLKLNHTVPASVRLLPAKEYRGAAIGINYDLRIYTAESIDEKPQRRSQIRMAIRLVQYAPLDLQQTEAPLVRLDKHFLLREGALKIEVGLDRQWYNQGSPIKVYVRIHNRSSRIVKKIQIKAVQHVDVTMFSNGKFKNTIAISEELDGLPLTAGNTLDRQYPLTLMENGGGRHWVALEDRYGRYVTIFPKQEHLVQDNGHFVVIGYALTRSYEDVFKLVKKFPIGIIQALTATLASTTLKSAPDERHFFAIYISYYVKIRLVVSGVGGDVSTKIPFVLMRDGPEIIPAETDNTNDDAVQSCQSPERQSSPLPSLNNASTLGDANGKKCIVENVPKSKETELVNAELYIKPKLLNSDQENPLNDIQQMLAHSNSPNEDVEKK